MKLAAGDPGKWYLPFLDFSFLAAAWLVIIIGYAASLGFGTSAHESQNAEILFQSLYYLPMFVVVLIRVRLSSALWGKGVVIGLLVGLISLLPYCVMLL